MSKNWLVGWAQGVGLSIPSNSWGLKSPNHQLSWMKGRWSLCLLGWFWRLPEWQVWKLEVCNFWCQEEGSCSTSRSAIREQIQCFCRWWRYGCSVQWSTQAGKSEPCRSIKRKWEVVTVGKFSVANVGDSHLLAGLELSSREACCLPGAWIWNAVVRLPKLVWLQTTTPCCSLLSVSIILPEVIWNYQLWPCGSGVMTKGLGAWVDSPWSFGWEQSALGWVDRSCGQAGCIAGVSNRILVLWSWGSFWGLLGKDGIHLTRAKASLLTILWAIGGPGWQTKCSTNNGDLVIQKIRTEGGPSQAYPYKQGSAFQNYRENSATLSGKSAWLITSLKFLCSHAHSLGCKEEELHVCMQFQSYDFIKIVKIW